MRFTKMEGLGNDYIYVNCLEGEPPDLPGLAARLSHRHFGVGADGLICIGPGRGGDFSMEMYNADGSRGAMCGNGIRCVGKYVYEKGLTRKTCLTIDTDAGPRGLELQVRRGEVEQVAVDMGPAEVAPPVEAEALGERSNIEFVSCPGREELVLRVWERGSGLTLACGTGACAAFAAARRLGRCGAAVKARLPGGALALEQRGGHIWMTGPARRVFEGEVEEISPP